MTTFTISTDNNITAFATPEAAQDTLALGAMSFSSKKELAKLAGDWPSGRLVEIWNGFAGVAPFGDLKPIKKFTDRKTAVDRVWNAIKKLAEAAEMEQRRADIREVEGRLRTAQQRHANAPSTPQAASIQPEVAPPSEEPTPITPDTPPSNQEVTAETTAPVALPVADVATKKAKATKEPSAKDGAHTTRESSKKTLILDLLRRKDGATLAEIAQATGWQNHSIRGFISGAITKKMGLKVESSKNTAGERCYRIPE
jgi:hypothetical protein